MIKNLAKERIVGKDDKYENTRYFIDNGVDVEKRRIMIDDEIDEISMGRAIRGILKMVDADQQKPIDVYLNTYGGSVYDCFALYDVLRSLDGIVIRTHALGKIMSAGFILFLAGDERRSYPRSRFMIHSITGGTYGKLHELETDFAETKILKEYFLDILAERTKKEKSWWKKEISVKDRYYSTERCEELGVVNAKQE